MIRDVVRKKIADGTPYIQIEDLSRLEGSSLEARRLFINDLKQRPDIAGFIFCNASALLRLSIKLGMRINPPPFPVAMAENLKDALPLARQMLADVHTGAKPISPPPIPSVTTRDHWSLAMDGFDLRLEVIDGDILHVLASGSMKAEYVEAIFDLQAKAYDEFNPGQAPYYLVVGTPALKDASMEARRLFSERNRQWFHQHPFQMLIFYRTNWMIRAAINLARVSAPYDIHVVSDVKDALSMIQTDKTRRAQPAAGGGKPSIRRAAAPHQRHVDELIRIMADISWDHPGSDPVHRKMDASHPFYPVVEALSLIKQDFDVLIAQREKHERAIQDSSEKYRNILNSIEEGYYETDLKGNLTFFNPSLCQILGYSKSELSGMRFQTFSDKDDIAEIRQTFNRVYRTRRSTRAFNLKLVRKDGTRRFVEGSIALIEDDLKQPAGFRGIIRDITWQIESETQKEKLEKQLRHAQKMEAIGTLAGGVAHDLNNILSGIVSYPDLLLMKLPPASDLRKPIETIKKSGERAAAIVADLLTMARKGLANMEVVNLNNMIEDYLKSPEHNNLLIYHPMVDVRTALDENPLHISASRVHLAKIMMNLVSNAAEAMPEGGYITISTSSRYMEKPLPGYADIKENHYVHLTVADEGTGISAEEKERIFEPFYTKKTMGRSGSGLGMALVWGAVQDHQGYIDIESTPGAGTAIHIYFPALLSEVEAAAKLPFALDQYPGKGESILVVDDLKEQRDLAGQILMQLGYSVETAPSGEAAIEHIRHTPVDLIILDMIMEPGLDGLDTFREIISINPAQKAVIATGFSTSERIMEAQALGAGGCLKKPYLLEDIAKTVYEILNSSS